MNIIEIALIIVLITSIIALFAIAALIRKEIEANTFKRFKEIEEDSSFADRLNLLKDEIDRANQKDFQLQIAKLKEYYISDAIKRSGSVSKGKIVEHFAPFIVNDVLNPNEIVFMGSPIDLISFTNIDNEEALSIDFLEIKSGNAKLNKKQKLIRNALNEKRVFYKKVMLQ